MDPWPLGDPSVIGSFSSRFACLDLNGEALCHMETDFLMEVPDTPDRVAARYKERNVACENVSTLSSMGLRRQDGLLRWSRNLTSETRGSDDVTVNSNSSTRREKWGSLTSRSLEARDPTPVCGGNTEAKRDLQDSTLVPGQAGVSGKNEPEVRGKVIDTRLKNTADSGSTGCMNGSSERGKDINRHSGLDFSFQVINLESSPLSRPTASMVNGVATESTDCSIEIVKSIDTGEGVDPSTDSQRERLQDESRTLKLGPPKTTGLRRSVRNGCLPRSIIEKGINSDTEVGAKGRLSNDGTSRDKGKAIELSPDSVSSSKAAMPSSFDVDACSRIPRPRRLVRNGCISPANIARNKALVAEAKDVNNKSLSIENPKADSLRHIHSSSHCHGKEKGKNIVDDSHLLNSEEVETRPSSTRLGTMPSNNLTVRGTDEEISWFVEEPGWITTGNRRGLSNGVTVVMDGVCHLPRHALENNADEGQHMNIVDDIDPSEFAASQDNRLSSNPVLISSNVNHDNENIRLQGSQRLIKGKRKIRSGRFLQGETSKAESSILLSPSLGESSNILSTGTSNVEGGNALLHSVVDVDEFSPPQIRRSCPRNGNISVSDGPSDRALQLESDELLARQLQEQLFNESLGPRSFEEIDASIAWRLQQEEDAQIISSTRSRRQSQPRDPSMGHLYRRYPRHSSRNSSGQLPRQSHSMPGISQLRRNLNRRRMDLESRLNYLEALEAAFNNGNDTTLPTSLFHMERDFNENDYEMLLALDNENHNHAGASHHQINNLPLSVVQTENPEETCAICLDAPSIGDKVRHLPCLHKFHKDCIDTWLRRKTSCPVCKSGIA